MPYLLFEEPPADLDEDARHGSLLGGMASPVGNFDMARDFRRAAEILVDRNTHDAEAYELLYPVLFAYRHALELYLKAILEPTARSHDLASLAERLTGHVEKHFGKQLSSRASRLIQDFAEYDPKGTSFRYGDKGLLEGEYWIELPKLRRQMTWLMDGLEQIWVHR